MINQVLELLEDVNDLPCIYCGDFGATLPCLVCNKLICPDHQKEGVCICPECTEEQYASTIN